jgi:hypothetical protein
MKRQKGYWSSGVVRWCGVGLAAWLLPVSLLACGPYFPNTLLDDPGQALRTMPEANFAAEMGRLQEDMVAAGMFGKTNWPSSSFTCDDPVEETLRADLSDLKEALATGPLPATVREDPAVEYEVFRVCLIQLEGLKPGIVPGHLPDLEPPAGLPKEFELYARGAVAYRRGDLPAARACWIELLALAPAERRFRSSWAAFMLGRSWQDEEPARAVDCFRLVRTLASASFHDSLGLALSSLGWEARAELDRWRFEEAAVLYLTQSVAGDARAVVSLQLVAHELVTGFAHRMPEIAAIPVLQRLATAYLVSRDGNTRVFDEASDQWLEAVQQAGVGKIAGADRLAWLAYRRGKPEVAQQWLEHAAPGSITARWLAAKLMLRQGKRHEAQVLLDAVTREIEAVSRDKLPSFAVTDEAAGDRPASRPAGELAALLMVDGRYAEAFDLLVRHGWRTDAAYVGERVLTLDELRRYVDERLPDSERVAKPGTQAGADSDGTRDAEDQAMMWRHLLARRLARAGALDASIPYFPPPWRERMEEYRQRLVTGRNTTLAVGTRAAALWRAARIARYWGLELFGTEVSPDWSLYEGYYELGYVEDRISPHREQAEFIGTDEVARTVSQVPQPGKRFHYRYVAADLAWEAARLMPNESTLTARVLCEAGLWLKDRDPKAADRFYKALVKRCGTTDLGREADRLRWFPRSPDPDHFLPGLRGE